MKKITLLITFMLATITWQTQAQVLTEDFENGVPPTNWTEVRSPSTSSYGWSRYIYGHTGSCARFDSYHNNLGNQSLLLTPSFDITSLPSPQLTFFYKNPSSGDFTVQISTDSGATFTDLATGLTGQTSWVEQTYDLSAYSSATVMLAFKGTSINGYSHDYIYLDDVLVQDASAPYNPEFNLDVANCINGQFSVNVNITDLGNSPSVTVSDDQGSTTQQATTTGTVIMGPYASGTSVNITVTNDSNNTITTSHSITHYCTPVNDECDNAIALTVNPDLNCGTTTHGTNANATASPQADDVIGTPDNDVWFSFVATQTRHFISLSNIISVNGAPIAIVMAVYDASAGCGNLTLVDDSNDSSDNSFTVAGLTVGTTYLLRVYGYTSDQANFDVCVSTLPSIITNDECDNAIALTVNPDVNCGTTTHGTNAGATASAQADDVVGTPINDVWFSFVATGVGHVISLSNITPVIGTSTYIAMAVYDASAGCGNLTLVDDTYQNSMIVRNLTVGTTYLLRVYGYSTAQTNFDVCIGTLSPPPVNDNFSGAIPITPSVAGTGCSTFTFQAWNEYSGVTDSGMDGSCDGIHTGLDVFYSWTATTNALMWNGGDGYPGIIIRDASGNEITCYRDYTGFNANNDVILNGWTVGQDLIIQIYENGAPNTDVSFCLEEYTVAEPLFTTTVNPDCSNFQFSVDVNLIDLGIATSVTVSDDQGSTTQTMSAPGTISFGPYASGTSVVITVTNDQDNNISSTKTVVHFCPPSNDECDNAIALTINPDTNCGTTTQGTNVAATASPQPDDAIGTPNDDVWFSFVATETTHIVSLLNITPVIYNSTEMAMAIYNASAGCGNLTLVDDSFTNSIIIDNLSVGTTYLLRVYSYSFAQTNFDICIGTLPPPPINDFCPSAIPLTVYNSCQPVIGNNFSAHHSGEPAPDCAYYNGGDIWYSVAVPADGNVTIETTSISGSSVTDTGMAIYSGSCGYLTKIECNDDIDYNGGNYFSMIDLTGQTPGDILYVRIWEFGNDSFGEIGICAHNPNMSIADNQIAGFKFYPNPVNHTLNLSAQGQIKKVSIYNITGQEVISIQPNAVQTQVDMSQLQNGIYFVKAQVNGQVTAFKVVKK